MPEHKPYTLKQDHRHYKKGETVLLRDQAAEALLEQGVVEKPKEKPDAKKPDAKKSADK